MCVVAGDEKNNGSLIGTLFCWGNDDYKQSHLDPGIESKVAIVKAGDWHTCAINYESQLGCWGDNSHGQNDIPDKYKTDVSNLAVKNLSTCLLIGNSFVCLGKLNY